MREDSKLKVKVSFGPDLKKTAADNYERIINFMKNQNRSSRRKD
jgi:hypothetical protein